jgi:hypothetical protein
MESTTGFAVFVTNGLFVENDAFNPADLNLSALSSHLSKDGDEPFDENEERKNQMMAGL